MRATRATIDLRRLRANLQAVRRSLAAGAGRRAPRICLAVKAAAYGHGAVPVARAALQAGVSAFGVATVAEGVELRDAGITAPILLFSLRCRRKPPRSPAPASPPCARTPPWAATWRAPRPPPDAPWRCT